MRKLILILFLGFTSVSFSQNTSIPDSNFEQALIDLGYDTAPINGSVPTANISGITSLDVNTKGILSLTGIEDFIALTYLNCRSNQLTSLDVSKNTALTDLYCYSNQLTSLDVSTNTALAYLDCESNQLTSLDVSYNTALKYLFCGANQLTSLDVNNTALTTLHCGDNQLTSLDVSTNTALTDLYCNSNQLTSLDVSNNTALTDLYCYSNQLTSLDVSNNTALKYLDCYSNQLTSLDVRNGNNTNFTNFYSTNNPNLTCIFVDDASYSTANWTDVDVTTTFVNNEAECEALNTTAITDPNFEQALIDLGYDTAPINGSLATADISGVTSLDVNSRNITDLTGIEDFTALTALYCYSNQLTSLDVSNNTALTILRCGDNQLPSLDVSNNTALIDLRCYSNQLTSLDVSNNTELTELGSESNQLTSLDVSTNTALTSLYCWGNQLTSLDVRNGNNTNFTNFYSSNNPNLTCIFVDDASYSTANWTDVDTTSTFVEDDAACNVLSVGDNVFEVDVSVYPNPTDNYLFIEGNKNPISISIYNLLGKKVMSAKNTNKVDVKELSSGVYIINISDGIGQTNRKFIKH
jgi:Leucine-rich repeat (LRR) protein